MAKMNKWGQVLNSLSRALGGKAKRKSTKQEQNPFDIFPSWFKSVFSRKADNKDKESVAKDKYSTGVETYLSGRKSRKQKTPVTYNDENYDIQSDFSSPSENQEINAPTNMGEYNELEGEVSYSDPVISTKPTPTSEKLGLPRPGASSFIQTARYNPQTKRLNILYTDGKIFPYQNVSPELADRILKKQSFHSPGQELLNTIFYGHGTTRADEIFDIEDGM